MTSKLETLPKAFIWRRLHSLTGLWFVLFLMEHLLTNSQAALLIGESGKGFVRMVNAIHNLPYLPVIEIGLLAIPIGIHMFWGVRYLFTAKFNSQRSNGSKPSLKYERNRAYTWQRITSWILVVLLILHVVKFRFLDYPHVVNEGATPTYYVKVGMDPGLYTVADRLNVTLYDAKALQKLCRERGEKPALSHAAKEIQEKESTQYNPQDAAILESAQRSEEKQRLSQALTNVTLDKDEVIATANNFGTASLLTVRNTFKNPIWVGIYTIFVLSAVFHAFNGLWTSMLTWGWLIKSSAQTGGRRVTIVLMILLGFLGLAAVWGTYFINLRN